MLWKIFITDTNLSKGLKPYQWRQRSARREVLSKLEKTPSPMGHQLWALTNTIQRSEILQSIDCAKRFHFGQTFITPINLHEEVQEEMVSLQCIGLINCCDEVWVGISFCSDIFCCLLDRLKTVILVLSNNSSKRKNIPYFIRLTCQSSRLTKDYERNQKFWIVPAPLVATVCF